jgi:hypothetical protein
MPISKSRASVPASRQEGSFRSESFIATAVSS